MLEKRDGILHDRVVPPGVFVLLEAVIACSVRIEPSSETGPERFTYRIVGVGIHKAHSRPGPSLLPVSQES